MCVANDTEIAATPPRIVCCTCIHCVCVLYQVYTWGCNDEGALGRITRDGEEYFPGLVDSISNEKILQVSAGMG